MPRGIDSLYFIRRFFATGLILSIVVLLMSSCAVSNQYSFGNAVTSKVKGYSLGQSMRRAVRDPNIWGTLLTAAILKTSGQDEIISDRLREDTPLFGSTKNASDASDNFRGLTGLGYVSTALLTPGPETTGSWLIEKSKLLGSEWLTVEMNQFATSEIKTSSGRERPNRRDKKSFLSGHTSSATTQALMAKINIENLRIPESSKFALSTSFNSFAALTGWARIEAGEHYPSDVLAGWALGHFVSYIGQGYIDSGNSRVRVEPIIDPEKIGIEINVKF